MAENNKCCADIVLSIVKEYVRLQIELSEEISEHQSFVGDNEKDLFDLLKYQYFYQDMLGQIKRAYYIKEVTTVG